MDQICRNYQMEKQNNGVSYVPKKQGTFYQLNLGKNNGPFLSKDIMFNNKKSMTLLTNKQILKSHQTMLNTIKNLQKNQNEVIIKPAKIQNFNDSIDFFQNQLKICQQNSRILRIQTGTLHAQFVQFHEKMITNIQKLHDSSSPGIKQFFKKVKQVNNNQKAQNYKIFRQLQQMEKQKKVIQNGLKECCNKIQILECIFGRTNEEEFRQ